jgi:hypothetical protein
MATSMVAAMQVGCASTERGIFAKQLRVLLAKPIVEPLCLVRAFKHAPPWRRRMARTRINTSRTLTKGSSPKVFGESANGFTSFDQPPDGIWKPAEHFRKMIRSASRRVSGLRRQTLAQRYGEASLRNTGGVCETTIRDPNRSHDWYNYNASPPWAVLRL